MKRWYGYILLGLGAYLFFLLWLLPAAFIWSYAESPLNRQLPQLEINGVRGRLWQGEIASLRYMGRELGGVSWRLSPWSLLLGDLTLPLSLQMPQGYIETKLVLPFDMSRLALQETKGRIPASQLQNLFPYYPVAIGGTFTLDLAEVQFNEDRRLEQLVGRVNWLGAEVLAPQAMGLGDLEAELTAGENGGMTARLGDRAGPLSLDGSFLLRPNGTYSLTGHVAAGAGADKELQQALTWLGRADAKGRYRLNLNGRLGS